jgi:hypothetical protein
MIQSDDMPSQNGQKSIFNSFKNFHLHFFYLYLVFIRKQQRKLMSHRAYEVLILQQIYLFAK